LDEAWYDSRIVSGGTMKRFIEGLDRSQTTLLPDCVDDYVAEDNPVRAIDAFVDMLDLASLGFGCAGLGVPDTTHRRC
jgi:transposase